MELYYIVVKTLVPRLPFENFNGRKVLEEHRLKRKTSWSTACLHVSNGAKSYCV